MSVEIVPPTEPTLLVRNKSLTLSVKSVADVAAVNLLKNTIYGTNGVRYRQTGQEKKVGQLHNPFFFHLYVSETLQGFYCLDHRLVNIGRETVDGFYGRYLAVNQSVQGKGYGRLLKTSAVKYITESVSSPHLFYSYIEEKNTRSLSTSEREGFCSVATLKTFIFRRYSPVTDRRFGIASVVDRTTILALLDQQYQNYSLKNFDRIGYDNSYFILRESGQIVAGVQANRACWQFIDMPGKKGWALMNLAPLVSVSRRFFNPTQQAFAVLEGLYLKEGKQNLLPVLLESVLAHFNLHSLMWQIDEQDPFIRLLTKNMMGPLSGFEADVRTHIMVKAVDLDAGLILTQQPKYVSCFDYS